MWMTVAAAATIEASTCRGTGKDLWRCGGDASGVVVHSSAPSSPEVREVGPLGPGTLVQLEGDRQPPKGQRGPRYGVRWDGGWLWADGSEGQLKPLFADWLARGGPGGGTASVAERTWEVPLGCWVEDGKPACADGSSAREMPMELGFTAVPCTMADGRKEVCQVTSTPGEPVLYVLAPTSSLLTVGCAVVEGHASACSGLVSFDPAEVGRSIPRPAPATCRLQPGSGEWRCLGSTLRRTDDPRVLTLLRDGDGAPRSLPGGGGLGLRVGEDAWVCGGAEPVCHALLEDLPKSPPGGGTVEVLGRRLDLPSGCQRIEDAVGDLVLCDDLRRAFTFDQERRPIPPQSAKCTMLGKPAFCWSEGSAVRASWKKGAGSVLCTQRPCPFEGLIVEP